MLPDGSPNSLHSWQVPSGSVADDLIEIINNKRGIRIAFDSDAEELTVFDQISPDGVETTQRRRMSTSSSTQSLRATIESLSPDDDIVVLDVVETDREGLADVVYVTRATNKILEQADVDAEALIDAAYGTPNSSLPTTSTPADCPPIELHITTVPTTHDETGTGPQQ